MRWHAFDNLIISYTLQLIAVCMCQQDGRNSCADTKPADTCGLQFANTKTVS